MKRLRTIQFFLVAVAIMLCISFMSAATVDGPTVYKNDTKYSIDEYPAEYVEGKVFVPINFFIGLNNIQYEYSSDPMGFYFINTNTGKYFSFSSTSKYIVANGEFTDISFPILNSTIYMPLDYCADVLSLGVEYKRSEETERVRVTDGTQKLPFDELIELYDPTEKPEEPPVTEPEPPVVRPEIPPISEHVEPTPEDSYIYLTFVAKQENDTDSIIELLNAEGYKATFYFDSESIKAAPQTVIRAFVSNQGIGIIADTKEKLEETNRVLYEVLYCYSRLARTKNVLSQSDTEQLTGSGYIVSTVNIDSHDQPAGTDKDIARSIYNKTFEQTVSVINIDAGEQSKGIAKQLLYYLSADEYATVLPISATVTNQEVKNG